MQPLFDNNSFLTISEWHTFYRKNKPCSHHFHSSKQIDMTFIKQCYQFGGLGLMRCEHLYMRQVKTSIFPKIPESDNNCSEIWLPYNSQAIYDALSLTTGLHIERIKLQKIFTIYPPQSIDIFLSEFDSSELDVFDSSEQAYEILYSLCAAKPEIYLHNLKNEPPQMPSLLSEKRKYIVFTGASDFLYHIFSPFATHFKKQLQALYPEEESQIRNNKKDQKNETSDIAFNLMCLQELFSLNPDLNEERITIDQYKHLKAVDGGHLIQTQKFNSSHLPQFLQNFVLKCAKNDTDLILYTENPKDFQNFATQIQILGFSYLGESQSQKNQIHHPRFSYMDPEAPWIELPNDMYSESSILTNQSLKSFSFESEAESSDIDLYNWGEQIIKQRAKGQLIQKPILFSLYPASDHQSMFNEFKEHCRYFQNDLL